VKPLPSRSAPHPSRLEISEYLAGKAAPGAQAAFEAHVAGCPDCEAMLSQARADRDAFASKYPSLEYFRATRRVRGRTTAPATPGFLDRMKGWWKTPAARPVFMAAAILALATVLLRWPSPSEDLSAKGAAKVVLAVNGKTVTGDTVPCKPGDTLQLAIVAAKPVHYAILYRDDGGALQAYMDDGRNPPRGGPRGENLPHSLVMSQGWAVERLYCVWSSEPFDAGSARSRAEGGPPGALGLRVFVLLNPP
jgi:hypothetical protein